MQFPIRLVVFLFIAIIIVLLLGGTLSSLASLRNNTRVTTISVGKQDREFTAYKFEFERIETKGNINYNFSLN